MSILVTGGAGFISANFVLDWLARADEPVIILVKLSYAGNLENQDWVSNVQSGAYRERVEKNYAGRDV